ncbi:hypothetical protein Wildcat_149 [Mycobacterium phage Wildcat]|uniref:Uncharacterized protein n=4 Tax=Mycobacterium virus Wildcat TaxID=1993859 RepID=Q19XT5_9CAUD|nr:hypothetical protein Wildcat_149 [Mycobacterium phage Wildcat]ABE67729.1 hypothetical protein Wildcat_149 [Mycobacterium phage Wildcat]QGJ90009.1 hypothetical protein PBI_MARYV_135 [Mycobacterium phage MaryV]
MVPPQGMDGRKDRMNGNYEIKGGRGQGYHVYHVNSTRRVWVGFRRTKREAEKVRLTKTNGRMRTR